MDLPFVGVYRTFSHVRAHEVRTQLEGAGIPSVLQTPMPYPYSVYPLLGPVEIAVPERENERGLKRSLAQLVQKYSCLSHPGRARCGQCS
jgi:hypothetical protein